MSKNQNKMKRSAERELAFRSVFQIDFHDNKEDAIQSIDAYLTDNSNDESEKDLPGIPGAFSDTLIKAVIEQKDTIDNIIKQYIKTGWTMNRIPMVEKTILRMATAEILFLGTPKEIAINEAVNLVKKYADEGAYRFVNGILNNMAKDHLHEQNGDE